VTLRYHKGGPHRHCTASGDTSTHSALPALATTFLHQHSHNIHAVRPEPRCHTNCATRGLSLDDSLPEPGPDMAASHAHSTCKTTAWDHPDHTTWVATTLPGPTCVVQQMPNQKYWRSSTAAAHSLLSDTNLSMLMMMLTSLCRCAPRMFGPTRADTRLENEYNVQWGSLHSSLGCGLVQLCMLTPAAVSLFHSQLPCNAFEPAGKAPPAFAQTVKCLSCTASSWHAESALLMQLRIRCRSRGECHSKHLWQRGVLPSVQAGATTITSGCVGLVQQHTVSHSAVPSGLLVVP